MTNILNYLHESLNIHQRMGESIDGRLQGNQDGGWLFAHPNFLEFWVEEVLRRKHTC